MTMLAAQEVAPSTRTMEAPVAELSTQERVVALYASDMPTGYSAKKDDQNLLVWILQGAERLGGESLRYQAAARYGYSRLCLDNLVTPALKARHRALFPLARRLSQAEGLASFTALYINLTPGALARNAEMHVPAGQCPCGGEGELPVYFDGERVPAVGFTKLCPVHRASAYQANTWADLRNPQAA